MFKSLLIYKYLHIQNTINNNNNHKLYEISRTVPKHEYFIIAVMLVNNGMKKSEHDDYNSQS